MEPTYFASAADFRAWLGANHSGESVLWIGFWKKGSGKAGMGYREALDEALCFGWIDGQVRSIDNASYMQRWTPRKKGSIWSAVNIRRMEELIAEGQVSPAGLAAFAARTAERSAAYSHEQAEVALSTEQDAAVRSDAAAWEFWERQPASYRKAAVWWVMSAKQERTRARRLEELIAKSRAGKRVAQFVSPARRRHDA